jgi:tetratricopeptide (TPR) repeat protein
MNCRLIAVTVAVAYLGLGAWGGALTRAQGNPARVLDLLDRYERGDHDGVVADLAAASDPGALARELQRRGEAWASPPKADAATVERRRLVAAVFTLDLAASHLETDWGVLRSTVEWACELIRKGRPTAKERVWHRAAVALAEGASDEYFLLWLPPYSSPDAIVRQRFASFVHAGHAARRFPDEIRFRVAEAFAYGLPALGEPKRDAPLRIGRQEIDAGEASIRRWKKFVGDQQVGAEAQLRIGHIYYCIGNAKAAVGHYQSALQSTQDPFLQYLAHFFTGRMHEAQGRRHDAAAAYRQALGVQPFVQSGTMALAGTLFLDEKPSEAYALVNAAFAAKPRPPDPWRLWGYGDYRFWPDLIKELRREIRP